MKSKIYFVTGASSGIGNENKESTAVLSLFYEFNYKTDCDFF